MTTVYSIFRRRHLGVIDALIGAGIVVVTVFAWAERSNAVVGDPGTWQWRLWHVGPLVFALIGVWVMWRNTSKVPWVRTLCLSVLALSILLNRYTDIFNNSGNLWSTINPLSIACASVAAVTGYSRMMSQRQGLEPLNPFTLLAGAIAVGLGTSVLIMAFFFGHVEVAWQVLDPLMILALLIWASAARRTGVGDAI